MLATLVTELFESWMVIHPAFSHVSEPFSENWQRVRNANLDEEKPSTGEPDAGDPQVRFGGGAASKTVIPPPIDFSTLNIDNPG